MPFFFSYSDRAVSVGTAKPRQSPGCYLNNQGMAKCRLEVPLTFASAQPDPAWGSGGACNEGQLGWAGKGSTHMSEGERAHTQCLMEKEHTHNV